MSLKYPWCLILYLRIYYVVSYISMVFRIKVENLHDCEKCACASIILVQTLKPTNTLDSPQSLSNQQVVRRTYTRVSTQELSHRYKVSYICACFFEWIIYWKLKWEVPHVFMNFYWLLHAGRCEKRLTCNEIRPWLTFGLHPVKCFVSWNSTGLHWWHCSMFHCTLRAQITCFHVVHP